MEGIRTMSITRESVPCDVELLSVSRDDIVSGYTDSIPGCGDDGTAWSYVSITLPGGIPVPTFTVCQQCTMEIVEGE